MVGLRSAILVGAVSLALGGCVASYELVRYNTAAVTQVHLGCHDTYEVFDRPDAGAMLVGTNVLNETLAATCSDGIGALPLELRLRRAAQIFLEEASDRPACRIAREAVLTPFQAEFNYVCPPPKPRRGVVPPQTGGRR